MNLKPGDTLHLWTDNGKTMLKINSKDASESLIFISDKNNPGIQTDLSFTIVDEYGDL